MHVASFTFFEAAASVLIALAVGIPAAFFCGRRRFFARKFLLSLSVVPFCVPSLIIALGYVSFLGVNGFLNRFLMFAFGLENPPVKILYSFFGLIIAQGFYNFPLIMKNVAETWQKIPNEKADSARLLGAGEWRVFWTVTIFQLLPSIASSSLLVFIYCFLSFILVLLFGGIGNSTLEVEIYKAARASLDFKTVFFLALVETLILCAVTVLYSLVENLSSKEKGLSFCQTEKNSKIKAGLETFVFFILMILIFVFFLMPLFGIIKNAFSCGENFFSLESFALIFKMKSFLPSLFTSLFVGLCTAFFCTFVGFFYSSLLRFFENKKKNALNSVLRIFPMLPMCVSSVVLGVVIILAVKKGNIFCLVAAQTLLNWPLAFKVIYPEMTKIPFETLDSALLLSKGKFDVCKRIFLPSCKKSLLSAFGFCFAMSAGDTTLPLVLSIPKFTTLSLFTYRLAGAYRFNEACAAGFVLAFICIAVFLPGNFSSKKEDS